MTNEAPSSLQDTHPERDLTRHENLERTLQEIIADANANGGGTIETISAMEKVLKQLRRTYDEDPDPSENAAETHSGDANDFGEFPSAEGLVNASIDGRKQP